MTRLTRGSLLQELPRANPWWTSERWTDSDPQLAAAAKAPFRLSPTVLDDIVPPNLYTLRGPRRVGKSTVLKQTVLRLCRSEVDPRRITFFAADSLSDFRDLINVFQTAHQLFPDLGDAARYFLIDEVTSIPEWQRGIKWLRDNTVAAGDCIVVSGSSAWDVASGTTHLAGRRGPAIRLDRLLLPLSFAEFARCAGYSLPAQRRLSLEAFYDGEGRAVCQDAAVHLGVLIDAFEAYLLVGGFPQAVADFRLRAEVSDGFARDLWDVIQSDLYTAGVRRPELGLRLLERIAASLTGPVALRDLAEDLGAASHHTAGSWLDILANAYLVLMLFQETGGVADLRKQRKVYPIDPFIAHLPSRHSPEAQDPDFSRLAEAALASAIFRSVEGDAVDRFGQPSRLFYYRSPRGGAGGEVDFVVIPGRRAAESKYVDTVSRAEARALVANYGGGLVLTRGGLDLAVAPLFLPAALFAWLLSQSG